MSTKTYELLNDKWIFQPYVINFLMPNEFFNKSGKQIKISEIFKELIGKWKTLHWKLSPYFLNHIFFWIIKDFIILDKLLVKKIPYLDKVN